MKLTESYIREKIEEAKPLVEEEMQLMSNLENYDILILSAEEISFKTGRTIKEVKMCKGTYNSPILYGNPQFIYIPNFKGNEFSFRSNIFHEITHNIQSSNFKDLYFLLGKYKYDTLNFYKETSIACKCLIEGDACLVQNSLSKRLGESDKIIHKKLSKKERERNYEKLFPYIHGEKILRQKANGGEDRDLINKLYTSSLQEIIDFFELPKPRTLLWTSL